MEITIQCVNFDKSESLNDYIAKKLTKLERFADIRTAEVTLRILHTSDKANKEIGVKLLAGDEEFYASRQTEVYEDAVGQVVEALERQIIKSKEKKQS